MIRVSQSEHVGQLLLRRRNTARIFAFDYAFNFFRKFHFYFAGNNAILNYVDGNVRIYVSKN